MLFYLNNKKNGTVTKTELKLNLQIKKRLLLDFGVLYYVTLKSFIAQC